MEKKYSNISLNNLKVLCLTYEDFISFKDKLQDMLKNTTLNTISCDLERLAQNKLVVSKENKNFYNDYKKIISVIRTYSTLPNFLYTIINEKENITPVLYYIFKHQQSVDKMLELIDTLKEMEFYAVNFNEKADFTNKVYRLCIVPSSNEINFVDNPKVVPGYEYDVIKYTTDDSPYLITSGIFNKASIALNSLTFDKERLPKSLTKSDLKMKLENDGIEEKKVIRDSVDLSVGLNGLKEYSAALEKCTVSLKDEMTKKEMSKALDELKENLYLIELIIEEHDKKAEASYEGLTVKFLDAEKEAYEKRQKSHIW